MTGQASVAPPLSWRRLGSSLALVLILLLSAFIQFSVVARTVVVAPFRADSREYFFSAYNLVHYGVYSRLVTWPPEQFAQPPEPDAVRTPGYPLFLALVARPEPSPDFLRRVVWIQAGLAVLSVWLMFLIASRFLPPGWSHAAALLTALSPHLAVMSTYLLSETLFTFLLFASVLMALIAVRSRRRWHCLAAGVICGLCSLVRPTLEFLPLAMLVAIVLLPHLRPQAKLAVWLFAGFTLVVAPSVWRNQQIEHKPGEPSLLVNFLLDGSYPGFMYEGNPGTYGEPYRYDPNITAASADPGHALRYIGARFARAPLSYLKWYLIGKPGFLLSWTNIDGPGDIFVYSVERSPYLEDHFFDDIRLAMYRLHWPLMLLGLLGIGLAYWRPTRWGLRGNSLTAARLVSAVVIYAIAFHMIGTPYPRYGIPFRPLLFPFAMLALSRLWRAGADRATSESDRVTAES